MTRRGELTPEAVVAALTAKGIEADVTQDTGNFVRFRVKGVLLSEKASTALLASPDGSTACEIYTKTQARGAEPGSMSASALDDYYTGKTGRRGRSSSGSSQTTYPNSSGDGWDSVASGVN